MAWTTADEVTFFANIFPAVQQLGNRTGVSPVFILAQIMLETGWGGSVIQGSHNLFNIKADSSWSGPTVTAPTREFINGQWVNTTGRFRVYAGYADSLNDWWNFLTSNPRYQNALTPETMSNPVLFAQALKAANFATDPNYVDKIVATGGSPLFTTTLNTLIPANTIDQTEWRLVHSQDSAQGGSSFVPAAVAQAAYDRVRNDLTASAPPVNSQTFQIGTATVRVYYGPGTYSNSGNCQFVGIGSYGSGSDAGYRAAAAAGYVVLSMGGTNVYTSAYATPPPALAEGQKLLAIFESAIAAAEGLPNPNDQIGSQAVFPATTVPLPSSVVEAALDSNWSSIAPAVAQALIAKTGMAIGPGGPKVVVNPSALATLPLTGGSSAWPEFNPGWVAPGDAVLLSDKSTLRNLVADAPGQNVVSFGTDATLDGRPGNDTLWAGLGDNTLVGGPGDILHGGDGNNVFVAGPNNVIYAGPGTNTFQVGRGNGQTTIYARGGGTDRVQFGSDIDPEDVHVVPRGWTDDLVLRIAENPDTVTLKDWYETDAVPSLGPAAGNPFRENPEWGTRVGQIVFADGTVWDAATLREKSLVADAAGETIVGFDTNDKLVGRRGRDELWAGGGHDTLIGGPGDTLHGGSGTDLFVSGRNNFIDAGSGTNTVEFGRTDGHDILNASAGGTTAVELGEGIVPFNLVFALQPNRVGGDDLLVSVHDRARDSDRGDKAGLGDDGDLKHDTSAGISVLNWNATAGASSASPPVTTFETKRAELAGTDVGPLIQAMATFTADTGLSWEQAIDERRHDVEAILSGYWHATGRQAIGSTEDQRDRGDHGDHGHGWSR